MKYQAAAALAMLCLYGALLVRSGVPVAPQPAAPDVVYGDFVPAARSTQGDVGPPGPDRLVVAVRHVGGDDPRQLYALVRSEPRDAVWANFSERLVRESLGSVPDVGRGAPLEVTCATSVCEVTGVAAAGAPPEAIRRAWEALRGAVDTPLIAGNGLHYAAATFGSGHSLHDFTIYYRRSPGPTAASR